jgi:1-aminocyclopropane-1-carboxylate deaminase/D-cysteine desulfhydrase-like pyridoxal-dependent ACC family enzyme
VMTAGAVQSNHARQTAAACARLSLRCELFLKESAPGRGESYGRSGNELLDRILGAKLHIIPGASNAETAMEERAEARGRAASDGSRGAQEGDPAFPRGQGPLPQGFWDLRPYSCALRR